MLMKTTTDGCLLLCLSGKKTPLLGSVSSSSIYSLHPSPEEWSVYNFIWNRVTVQLEPLSFLDHSCLYRSIANRSRKRVGLEQTRKGFRQILVINPTYLWLLVFLRRHQSLGIQIKRTSNSPKSGRVLSEGLDMRRRTRVYRS